MPLPQGLDKLMSEVVGPTMAALGSGEMREALYCDATQMHINDNVRWIEAVYYDYAQADQSDGGRPTMNLTEFFIVMKDAGLLTEPEDESTTAEHEELTEEEQHGLLLELLLASRCWCRFSGESTEVEEDADANAELCGG